MACDAPLAAAGLVPAQAAAPADVTVHLAGLRAAGSDAPEDGKIVEPSGGWLAWSSEQQADGERMRLRFGYGDHHVDFDVSHDGKEIAVTWTAGVVAEHVATLLLTTVMGYLLRCHHRVALHASVVARGDAAFAYAGAPGAGKSTTVAALTRRGGVGFGDDIAALSRAGETWRVHPGLATVRLAPDAVAALAIPEQSRAPIWPQASALTGAAAELFDDKVVVPVSTDGAGLEPRRLAGVFLLGPRSAAATKPVVTRVPAAEAVPRLAAQLLTPAWLGRAVDGDRFAALAEVARRVPVYTVDRPDSLAALPDLCAALEEQMDALA